MKLASELRKNLDGLGLSEEQVEKIVADQITKGEVRDDSTTVSPADVAAVAAELRKSLGDLADGKTEDLAKGTAAQIPQAAPVREEDGETVYLRLNESIESVTGAVNAQSNLLGSLVKANSHGDSLLGKGLMAVGRLAEMSLNAQRGLAAQVEALQKSLDDVQKHLGQPVTPRAFGAYNVIEQPGEAAKKAADAANTQSMQKSGVDVINLIKSEMAAVAQTVSPTRDQRLSQLASATAEIDSGIPVNEVCQKYSINLG